MGCLCDLSGHKTKKQLAMNRKAKAKRKRNVSKQVITKSEVVGVYPQEIVHIEAPKKARVKPEVRRQASENCPENHRCKTVSIEYQNGSKVLIVAKAVVPPKKERKPRKSSSKSVKSRGKKTSSTKKKAV